VTDAVFPSAISQPPFVPSEVEASLRPRLRSVSPSTALGANGGRRFSDKAGGAGRFSDNAARLAGLAGALMGWRPDEFWRATPAELEAILAALAGPRGAGQAPPDAATIAALKEQFPDG